MSWDIDVGIIGVLKCVVKGNRYPAILAIGDLQGPDDLGVNNRRTLFPTRSVVTADALFGLFVLN